MNLATDIIEPQAITEEIVIVSNGHHSPANNLNGHHDESHQNGQFDGEIESNGHFGETDEVASLKKKHADTSNHLPTEA